MVFGRTGTSGSVSKAQNRTLFFKMQAFLKIFFLKYKSLLNNCYSSSCEQIKIQIEKAAIKMTALSIEIPI